jgi:hypothetical protein
MKQLAVFLVLFSLCSCEKQRAYTCRAWDPVNKVPSGTITKQMTESDKDKYNLGYYVTDTAGNSLLFLPDCK